MMPATPITQQDAELVSNMTVAMVATGMISGAAAQAVKTLLHNAANAQVAQAAQDSAPLPRMLRLKPTAKALDMAVCTVRRMLHDGRLPGRKVGGQWRVPLSAIEALAEVGEG
jgi:excisionase family DNA binding protein